jgi:dihydrofolate reductase
MHAPLQPLVLVLAAAKLGAIGKDGKIPWHFQEDMRHFKAVTSGHAVIMGRKTFDSIGKPLPNRRNIVVTRSPDAHCNDLRGITIARSVTEAVAMARETDVAPRVIGGAEIYALTVHVATIVLLTEIDLHVEGADTFFHFDKAPFREVSRTAGENSALTFSEWERRDV